jgi:hypothetical protein
MKKLLIGALVGGILLFFWQFLSWSVLGVHTSMQSYTPNQAEVLKYLDENLEEGFYYLPTAPASAPAEEHQKLMEDSIGKPWAQVYMHKKMEFSMGGNLGRGFAVAFIAVLLLSWVLMKNGKTSLIDTLLSCLAIGIMSYLTTSYAVGIWYETKTMGDLIDAIAGWGIVGLWLGWWLNRD